MYFLTGEKTAGCTGLAFKESVKDKQIHIFHLILLCYNALQRRESVKDATGILFLMWIDRLVKDMKPSLGQLLLLIVQRLPKSIVTPLKWMFSALK